MSRPDVPTPLDATAWRRGAAPYRVCFVCTGNICRSPMAASVLGHLAEEIPLADGTVLAQRLEITSAGTGPWHEGEPMDPRAAAALAARGHPSDGHTARQVTRRHLGTVDLVVALDRRHRQTLLGLVAARADTGRFVLLRPFDPDAGGALDVPDPYYDDELFAVCLTMVEAACAGLADALAARLRPAALPA